MSGTPSALARLRIRSLKPGINPATAPLLRRPPARCGGMVASAMRTFWLLASGTIARRASMAQSAPIWPPSRSFVPSISSTTSGRFCSRTLLNRCTPVPDACSPALPSFNTTGVCWRYRGTRRLCSTNGYDSGGETMSSITAGDRTPAVRLSPNARKRVTDQAGRALHVDDEAARRALAARIHRLAIHRRGPDGERTARLRRARGRDRCCAAGCLRLLERHAGRVAVGRLHRRRRRARQGQRAVAAGAPSASRRSRPTTTAIASAGRRPRDIRRTVTARTPPPSARTPSG